MKATIKNYCVNQFATSKFKPLYFGDNNLCKKEDRKKNGNTLS